jgi:hypothetical protein
MDFETYLQEKKIDSAAFRAAEPGKWQQFKALFEQVHPNSFTTQKKYLINDLRRLYPGQAVEKAPGAVAADTPAPEKTEAPVIAKAPVPAKLARPVVKRAVIPKKPESET